MAVNSLFSGFDSNSGYPDLCILPKVHYGGHCGGSGQRIKVYKNGIRAYSLELRIYSISSRLFLVDQQVLEVMQPAIIVMHEAKSATLLKRLNSYSCDGEKLLFYLYHHNKLN